MGLNLTNFAHALKTLYPQSRTKEMTYKSNPLLAMLPKNENAGGENIVLSMRYADPQGRSATFATAKANKGNQAGIKFTLTRAQDHGFASVSDEVVLASKGNEHALLKAYDSEIEGAFNGLVRSAAIAAYGDGSGKIGQVGSVGSGVITLASPTSDVTNFEYGMKIVANPTLTGTSGNMRSGVGTVTDVDRGDTPTVTYSGTITSIAANDYLYVEGDYDAKIKGLAAWLPSSVTATTFFGVDRTADATRLGGVRYDGSSGTIKDALIKGLMRVGREGGSPDYGFMNFEDFANLELELDTRVQYVDVEAMPGIGFRGIKVVGPKQNVTIIPDMNCPKGTCFMLQMNTWKLFSLGKVPHITQLDGNKALRESDSAGQEIRLAYYAQLGCEAPGYNARISLPT